MNEFGTYLLQIHRRLPDVASDIDASILSGFELSLDGGGSLGRVVHAQVAAAYEVNVPALLLGGVYDTRHRQVFDCNAAQSLVKPMGLDQRGKLEPRGRRAVAPVPAGGARAEPSSVDHDNRERPRSATDELISDIDACDAAANDDHVGVALCKGSLDVVGRVERLEPERAGCSNCRRRRGMLQKSPAS